MLYLLIALLVLGLVAAATELVGHRHAPSTVVQVPVGDCVTCNGNDARCEQVCVMEAATKPIEYFDDEELDLYKGRPSDSYRDDETEQFAQVLETLRPDEVRDWGRSLILRGINMPDGIKDEYIMLANQMS